MRLYFGLFIELKFLFNHYPFFLAYLWTVDQIVVEDAIEVVDTRVVGVYFLFVCLLRTLVLEMFSY